MLLIVEKKIRGEICHAIHSYVKSNNKYMKNYDKDKKSSYIIYLDTNNLNGWGIFQKLPVNNFKLKIIYQILLKSWFAIMKIVIKDIFLK